MTTPAMRLNPLAPHRPWQTLPSVLMPYLAGTLLAWAGVAQAAHPVPTRLAWLEDEQLHASQAGALVGSPEASAWHTPLGSTWKLFVYTYLHAKAIQESPYRCSTRGRQADEEYCCEPGESITRDQALTRSCGPYFAPQRLGIADNDWRSFWRQHDAPAWLVQVSAMQPSTEVPIPELLSALRHLPDAQRQATRQALLPLSLRDEPVLQALGAGTRFKTWSWQIEGARAGGAAGWRADGTPFWFGAAGTSRTALTAHAGWIAQAWQAPELAVDNASRAAQTCIAVRFFQRYPLRSVQRSDGRNAPEGAMNGRYRITFRNGTELSLTAEPSLTLLRGTHGPEIHGRLTLEDYVARVVDREGDARETHAARALAVAARTYVLQNATQDEGCHHIDDNSRQQRVSPNPPTLAARAAAQFTEGLILTGRPVRYHHHQAAPGVMAWDTAVTQSRSGLPFDAILRSAYPGTTLDGTQAATDCEALPEATQWLLQRQRRWREVLHRQAGYQALGDSVSVCQLAMGTPHSDQRRQVIRLREWHSREGRVTLIHEYLHLSFRDHPNGRNEEFIEQLAQRLADL